MGGDVVNHNPKKTHHPHDKDPNQPFWVMIYLYKNKYTYNVYKHYYTRSVSWQHDITYPKT